jgi:hypothetical protein
MGLLKAYTLKLGVIQRKDGNGINHLRRFISRYCAFAFRKKVIESKINMDEDNAYKEMLERLTPKQREAYDRDPFKFLFGVSLQLDKKQSEGD